MKKKLIAPFILSLCLGLTSQAKDVSITLPNGFSVAEFPEADQVIENEDGSTSITLTEKQTDEWKEFIKKFLDDGIKETIDDDENYPAFVDLKYNDDFTEIEMYLDSSVEQKMEGMLGLTLMAIVPMYQQLDGIPEEKIDFVMKTVDADTKEEIASSTFKETMEELSNLGVATTEENSAKEVDKTSFDTDSAKLEYSGFEFMDHSPEGTLVVIKYNFVNKTEQPANVGTYFYAKAFQNGVELTPYMGLGNAACDNTYSNILKDTEIEIGFAYLLKDTENPVTIYTIMVICQTLKV